MSQTNQGVIGFCFALFCFDGEADAKQELESMSIPDDNYCDVCRNECLLIEAMDSVEVDDKQMKDQPPETEK